MFKAIKLLSILPFIVTASVHASSFTLTSEDIAHNTSMSKQQEFKGSVVLVIIYHLN